MLPGCRETEHPGAVWNARAAAAAAMDDALTWAGLIAGGRPRSESACAGLGASAASAVAPATLLYTHTHTHTQTHTSRAPHLRGGSADGGSMECPITAPGRAT
ncbi:hypothetical protein HPB50_017188 [Hyalomma asiaticum]|uniref:Uncharacterized protein n=1 Tax=Hyalomma asiaticum TaxID=266040 RepID=A0ACB7TM12_HYAAI|nr:hypothetical protein HPB50_017188 [Hyalomma asiaticum]